ncbi:MAG: helix-turn-helix transcriptional regulator [Pseudomonadota bacterium]|nr:helix-turn-helix transcriptional regulator [Pseudomonadota bacterium]
MAKRNANPVDVHVGNRIRMRRVLIGMSQEKLGDRLGLTFQQVQKYEKGSNRVSASRLFAISEVLGVTLQFFYDGMPGAVTATAVEPAAGEGGDPLADLLSSAEGRELSQAFTKIRSAEVRRRILDLIRAIAAE